MEIYVDATHAQLTKLDFTIHLAALHTYANDVNWSKKKRHTIALKHFETKRSQ